MNTVKQWLESCGMLNVTECNVLVTNGKRKHASFSGCVYNDPRFDNKVVIYLLGDVTSLPGRSTSKTTVFYVDDIQQQEFILSSYTNDSCLTDRYKMYHPFGHNFMLSNVSQSFVASEKMYNKVKYNSMTIV